MENDFLKKTPGRRVLFSAALLASLCVGSPQFSYAATENVQTVMQNGTVKGRIVDGTGEPVIGASVQVKGSGTGVISDIDGNFTLSNVSSDAVLVISYVGYQTQEIKVAGKFNRIVAISRGGLIPAGILAYELEIRDCDVINMSSYDGEIKRQNNAVEIKGLLANIDEKTLIVDDLSDSGRTLDLLHRQYPKATRVCVYTKPKGQASCEMFAKEQPDQWIVFPWD